MPSWPTMLPATLVPFWLSLSSVPRYEPVILDEHPHDATAFTQGLLWHDGVLFETTGHYGQSTLRAVSVADGSILRQVELPAEVFGEGLARVDNELIVLTWREGRALVYDLESFRLLREYRYTGEGWGLCHDGQRLVMSNGTSTLQILEPRTFAPLGTIQMTKDDVGVDNLNELECAHGLVYANVWPTDRIVVVDPTSGRVRAEIDGTGLATRALAANEALDVFNGIAAVPNTETFYVTGKRWPSVYRIRVETVESAPRPVPADEVPSSPEVGACGCTGRQPIGAWLLIVPVFARLRSPRN